VLVPDAFGLSCLRLESFTDADCAASYIQSRSTNGTNNSIYAFWALHGRPAGEAENGFECLVLIRRENDSGVVSPLSFVDMESAVSAARYELRTGLDPRLLLIFWGVPVTIEFGNQGKVSLNPAVPPGTVAVLERPASEEVETHATPIVTVPHLTESEVSHKVPAAASTQATLDGTFSTPTPALMPILDLRPDSLTPNEAMTGGEAIHQETQAVNMAEKAETETETTNGVGGEPDEGATEATRVMRERRLKPRDGPFRGFGSPPGRF
jgi:hypothetical protein